MSMRRGPEKNGHDHGASAGNCREARRSALGGSGGRAIAAAPHIGSPLLVTLTTAVAEAEERQTTAADAALVSWGMAHTQLMREEEYRDGKYAYSQ
jgi:hypothetical protein